MTTMNRKLSLLALAAFTACATCGVHAQQNVKPPKLQLWMDVSTGGMAGMPEMDAQSAGMMGAIMGGGQGGATSYGMARGLHFMPPRVLDIALYNSLRPGREAQQLIPPGMRMGESLALVPPQAEPREREPGTPREDMKVEKPKGRILVYWGCGETVRAGQPRVIDFARASSGDFGAAFSGRYAADRGAKVTTQYAVFPNERNRVQLARDSSLAGEHRLQGEGIPASMKFTLGAGQDLMPAIALQTRGGLKDSVALSWDPLAMARGYFIQATGSSGDDLVMWSSAETADTGAGLFDYLPNASIERWVKERVLLKPDTAACAVPKGIFANSQGAMARMIAYGGESNFAHPPRPADPKATWEPEWAVRVRVKSATMAMLGEDSQPASRRGRQEDAQAAPAERSEEPASAMPNPGSILRGIFGR